MSAFKKATPYDQGYQAAMMNRQSESNPFPKGTSEHTQWSKGYVRGKLMNHTLGGK